MESRINILSELQSISPVVAKIGPINPYEAPKGYFENFASQMLELMKETEPSAVLMKASQNPYKVPENYFNNLPEQILLLVKNEEASDVLKDKANNPYQVPSGYFEGLADQILSRVKAQDQLSAKEELESLSPLLGKLDKKVPFTTPAGYFDDLTGNVVAGMKAIEFVNEELENLSPLMSSLKAENVYEVPVGYFDDLPISVLDKVKKNQPAKVVSISFKKRVMKYAAAAVVVGMIITAGLLFINRNPSTSSGAIVQNEEKIQQETQNNVKELSDDELVNFIENQTAPLPELLNLTASDDINSDDVKLMLADIPDAELQQYLVEYSDDKILTN